MISLNTTKTVSWLAMLALLAVSSVAIAGSNQMSARAKEALENRPLDMVELILTYHKAPGPNDRASVNNNGGKIRHEFKFIKGHAITVPANMAVALRNNPNIASINYDEPVSGAALQYETLDDGLYQITGLASKAVASLPSSVSAGQPGLNTVPYTGAGVRVAVLDSGFINHGDLNPWHTLSLAGTKVDDKYGHGNHVAAIFAGNGSDSSGKYRGVAPGVDLVGEH